MNTRNYIPRMGEIVSKENLSADTVALTIKLAGAPFAFRPGQFVMLSVFGYGEIPVGIASSPSKKGEIEVAVRSYGTVSQKIVALQVGDQIGVAGPLGNGLPMSRLRGKDVLLVAGGLGLPPLRSFVKIMAENPKLVKSLTVMIGAKTPEDLLYRAEYEEWAKWANIIPIVDKKDKDWKGAVGRIPELFAANQVPRGTVMLVCGPPAMFPAVVTYYAGKRVAEADLYFFLERRMHCGVGKCQHCTCGGKYVCLDGPVFPYSEIKYNPEALS